MRHQPVKLDIAKPLASTGMLVFCQMITYHLIFKDSYDFTSSSPTYSYNPVTFGGQDSCRKEDF